MEYGKQAIGSMGHMFAWSKSGGNGEVFGYVENPDGTLRSGMGGYYCTANPAKAAAVAETRLLAELAAEAAAADGSKVNRQRLSRYWYAAWNNGHTRQQVEAGTAAMLEGDIGAVELAAERAEYWLQWALYWLALAMGAATRPAPWATQRSSGTGGR